MNLPEAALIYGMRSFAVFPVTPGQKTPLTFHGCHDATSDENQIRAWWRRWPSANIGLATGERSGLIALDFDTKQNKPGLGTLEFIESRFLIDTLTARTPSGGIHKFFQYPGRMLRNNVEILPGMDIRTTGGYVVIAPSVVNGNPYTWINNTPAANIPPGLLALLQKPIPSPSVFRPAVWSVSRLARVERARRYLAKVPGAVQGQAGDITTYKLACRLVRGFALATDEALMLLQTWNWRCVPPWSETELRSKIASAERNGREPIGTRLEAGR